MQRPRPHERDRATIGVVIPAHDRADTIERAVLSALEQSRPPDRVIVVDDGSTDGTAECVRRMGPAVRLVEQANAGAAAARNSGVRELDSEWIAFLDSDDHWTEGHLARVDAAIAATGGAADVYFTDASSTEFGDASTLWGIAGVEPGSEPLLVDDATAWVMLPLQPIAIQSSVVRRSRYLDLGGMWPALRSREDTHLLFRLGLGRPMCAVPGVGVVITADDRTGARLTVAAGSGTADYDRCTVLLYRDLLDRSSGLADGDRRVLQQRLLDGYLAQASSALRNRDLRGVGALANALRVAPVLATRRVAAALGPGGSPS